MVDDSRITATREQVKQLAERDIAHVELGTVSGFQDGERQKNELCSYVEQILGMVEKVGEYVSQPILEAGFTHVDQRLQQMTNLADQIDELASQGVHNENFPNQRTHHINHIEEYFTGLQRELHQVELALSLESVKQSQSVGSDSGKFQAREEEATRHAQDLARLAAEARKVLDSVQGSVLERGVDDASASFTPCYS